LAEAVQAVQQVKALVVEEVMVVVHHSIQLLVQAEVEAVLGVLLDLEAQEVQVVEHHTKDQLEQVINHQWVQLKELLEEEPLTKEQAEAVELLVQDLQGQGQRDHQDLVVMEEQTVLLDQMLIEAVEEMVEQDIQLLLLEEPKHHTEEDEQEVLLVHLVIMVEMVYQPKVAAEAAVLEALIVQIQQGDLEELEL